MILIIGGGGSIGSELCRQLAEMGPKPIPEASQLILASGALSKNGNLFVHDFGELVNNLDLAECMINLFGARGV